MLELRNEVGGGRRWSVDARRKERDAVEAGVRYRIESVEARRMSIDIAWATTTMAGT